MTQDPVDHVVDPGGTSVTSLCSESGGTDRLEQFRWIQPNWSGGIGDISLGRRPPALSLGLHGQDRLERQQQLLTLSEISHVAGLPPRCPPSRVRQ
jgi:hypothetical protein